MTSELPVSRDLRVSYVLSWIIVVLMGTVSILALLNQATIYPTEIIRQSFVATDLINLFIGVPILIGSMWLTWRGKLLGLLFWPGALFYAAYHYIAYTFGVPVNLAFLFYLILTALSTYATVILISGIDWDAVKARLEGKLPIKYPAGLLVFFGFAFMLRVIWILLGDALGQTPVSPAELPVLVSDFLTLPAWIIGGVLLWQRRALGYVSSVGLLFQGSMLFTGLIIFMAVQPLLTEAAFDLWGILLVAIMGMICFVPFGLSVRAVLISGQEYNE